MEKAGIRKMRMIAILAGLIVVIASSLMLRTGQITGVEYQKAMLLSALLFLAVALLRFIRS